jgi:hypothetical protein
VLETKQKTKTKQLLTRPTSLEMLKKSVWELIVLEGPSASVLSRRSGGTPTMMGQQPRVESLFYYFRREDQISEDHLLRLIDRYVDFSFVRERLKNFYSSTGRPSIDPEVLLRLLLVGYLYGITSERRLLDEVRMHLAYIWRWMGPWWEPTPADKAGEPWYGYWQGFN